jgi:hypothetical protein
MPQEFDSTMRESGTSGARYSPNAAGVDVAVTVAVGSGTSVEVADGISSGVSGTQETMKIANKCDAMMRARFVIMIFSHEIGNRTRGSLILQVQGNEPMSLARASQA